MERIFGRALKVVAKLSQFTILLTVKAMSPAKVLHLYLPQTGFYEDQTGFHRHVSAARDVFVLIGRAENQDFLKDDSDFV